MSLIVSLVPVAPHHAEAIQHLVIGSRDIVEQTRLPDPYPEEGASSWIDYVGPRHKRGEEYAFAIVDALGEVAGMCGLIVQESRREAELGYWVGFPHRGRGYASDAARQAAHFAFVDAGMERVFALPLATNVPSRHVLVRAGFRFIRLQPAEDRWAGQEQALYETTRADFLGELRLN